MKGTTFLKLFLIEWFELLNFYEDPNVYEFLKLSYNFSSYFDISNIFTELYCS